MSLRTTLGARLRRFADLADPPPPQRLFVEPDPLHVDVACRVEELVERYEAEHRRDPIPNDTAVTQLYTDEEQLWRVAARFVEGRLDRYEWTRAGADGCRVFQRPESRSGLRCVCCGRR